VIDFMTRFDQSIFHAFDAFGWLLCELAFKTGCRGPLASGHRLLPCG